MYQCLQKNFWLDEAGYQLVPIRQEDVESIRQWRNAQMEVLRQQKPLSKQEQIDYFQQAVWPTFSHSHPRQILFSFLYKETCIGYGGLTYCDWVSSRAEVSFLLNPERVLVSFADDFTHFLQFLCQVAFDDLHLHRLFSESYAYRKESIAIQERCGFKREGILKEHIYKQGKWHDSIFHGLLASEWKQLDRKGDSILITSISKKMPLIEAVRRASDQIDLHGSDSNPNCIGQYGVDHFWHCPSLEKLTIEKVVAYCHQNSIKAIIPTRDADLEFFAHHLALLKANGIHPMVSSAETIALCLDKKKFADFLLGHHFSAIPTYLSIDDVQSDVYVVKERRGAGSQQMGLHLNHEQAMAHAKKLKEPIFQPFVKGKEWSVDLYRTFTGVVKGVVARQRDYIVAGESQVTTTHHYVELETLCQRLADKLDLHGHTVIQLIERSKGDFQIVECNPRFGGASTASLAVGLNSFAWFLAESLGHDLNHYPFVRKEGEIRQIRYPTDRILPWSSSST